MVYCFAIRHYTLLFLSSSYTRVNVFSKVVNRNMGNNIIFYVSCVAETVFVIIFRLKVHVSIERRVYVVSSDNFNTEDL